MIQKVTKVMSQKTNKQGKYAYFISNGKCKENSNVVAAHIYLTGKN